MALATVASCELPVPLRECAHVLECPITGERLVIGDDEVRTLSGSHSYIVSEGIPELLVPAGTRSNEGDVTGTAENFVELLDYDGMNSRDSLSRKMRQNVFAAALDEQLPTGAVVLEAGCGTGQLGNFLGMSWRRRVFSGDVSLNSLRLANRFRDRFRIVNTAFLQMNLFQPPFRDGSLDVVIANAGLYHTDDARSGFEVLVRKIKPGGLILVGLYNRLGRLPVLWRRRVFERFGPSRHVQHTHPRESSHSIGEVLRWFDENGVQFLFCVPPIDGSAFFAATPLFTPRSAGRKLQHLSTELKMLLDGMVPERGADAGLFIMIGRRT